MLSKCLINTSIGMTIWHINDDPFYSDMAPPKELEFDKQREYMFNGSSNIFFSSENKLITYHYNSLDNIIYFSKIDTKGTSKEKLTHSKTKKTEQRGVFLGDYYIDFDENYYHTWLVDKVTIRWCSSWTGSGNWQRSILILTKVVVWPT